MSELEKALLEAKQRSPWADRWELLNKIANNPEVCGLTSQQAMLTAEHLREWGF